MLGAVLLRAQDGVLGRFGDPELHNALGFDLDRFTSRRIAPMRAGDRPAPACRAGMVKVSWRFCRPAARWIRGSPPLVLGEIVLGCDFSGDL